ncbi:VOC family protein [Kitasatospora sp. NPDC088346]|uniref:VOC family protein n=1 Tax=Kitasatospora sp. NPDC088346 TaxID=3364073 RepID=UPI003813E965
MTAVQVRLAQGTPCWVSLTTGDPDGARAFYGSLLGWEFEPDSARAGGCVRAAVHGTEVAALGAAPPGRAQPACWTTYFTVDSADLAAQRIRECGGTVAVGPLTVDRIGRTAIAADLSGAVFGIWEAAGRSGREPDRRAAGRERADRPGEPAWNELVTADEAGAAAFYRAVLGRPVATGTQPDGTPHDGAPAGGPPHWRVHFAVADTDLAVHRALALGGVLRAGPYDTPDGRVARLADPQGGRFAVAGPGRTASGAV